MANASYICDTAAFKTAVADMIIATLSRMAKRVQLDPDAEILEYTAIELQPRKTSANNCYYTVIQKKTFLQYGRNRFHSSG